MTLLTHDGFVEQLCKVLETGDTDAWVACRDHDLAIRLKLSQSETNLTAMRRDRDAAVTASRECERDLRRMEQAA